MKKTSFLFIVFILIISCRKKPEWPAWDVNVLFPVAGTTLRITDLVKDTILRTNADQSLSLVYSGEVYTLDLDSMFKIPDTTISQFFLYPFSGFTVPPGYTITDQVQQTKYDLDEVELTKAVIRSGSIDIQLISFFQGRTLLTYELPMATLNGVPLSVTDTLPAATPADPSVITRSYDVTGYEFDLRGLNGNSFNTIVSSFKAVAIDTTYITPNDTVKIANSLVNIIPEFAKGYFGQTIVQVDPENQAVKKLHNIISGTFDLKYFDLTMKINNGIGADIRFLLQQVTSSNISSGQNASLTGSVIGSSININRAALNTSVNDPPVTYSEYVIAMDNSNSNADELIEIFPDSISSAAEIRLNPMGNISNSNDFIYYGNGINITLDAEIPLHFAANDLVLSDTVAINFQPTQKNGEEEDLSRKIKGGSLILDVYNGYPLRAKPQLYLMDEYFGVTDSLAAPNSSIEAAELDADFYAVGQKFSKVFIPVDQDKIEKLKSAKNLMIKLSFFTPAPPSHVKIYSVYKTDIKVVADIHYLIENN